MTSETVAPVAIGRYDGPHPPLRHLFEPGSGWMPAAAVYLRDPDGHLLEYLAMLDDPPKPERGITTWSEWRANLEVSQRSDNAPAIAV